MTAMRSSHHKALCSDGVVSPQVCDPMVAPHRWVMQARWNPAGQPWTLVVTLPHVCDGLRVLWDGGVADVPLARHLMRNVWLNLPTYYANNCLPPKKLR